MKYATLTACAALLLSACAPTLPTGQNPLAETPTLQGPQPTVTYTPSDTLLSCVAEYRNKRRDLRVAVGDIVDGTGAKTFADGSSSSPLFSQRPDLMVTVALAKTGITVLNRTSFRVSEWELAQAMEKRLGEGYDVSLGEETVPFRPVAAGGILGSNYYLTGAITEVNWNIDSSGARYNILGAHSSQNAYRISIAVDLVLTETTTTRVVKAQSFTKQLVGLEIEKGVFRFFSTGEDSILDPIELFDASVGEQQNEPVQRALRWVLEYGTYEMIADVSGARDQCDPLLVPTVLEEPAPVEEPEVIEEVAIVEETIVEEPDTAPVVEETATAPAVEETPLPPVIGETSEG